MMNEFSIFQQTIITPPNGKSRSPFSLQLIATDDQVKDLIQEFEPNTQLQEKGQLSLNG